MTSINWGLSHTPVLIPSRITLVRTIWNLETSASAHSGAQYQLPGANQEFFNEKLYLSMYHTRLSHRRGLTHSSQPKRKKGGDSDIQKFNPCPYNHIHGI